MTEPKTKPSRFSKRQVLTSGWALTFSLGFIYLLLPFFVGPPRNKLAVSMKSTEKVLEHIAGWGFIVCLIIMVIVTVGALLKMAAPPPRGE